MSVEYLFLLMVIIIVFGFMITNFIGPTIDASNDVSDVSAASNAINSIANAANMVYANGPMSKRTITYHVPFNMILTMGQTGTNTGYISSIITLSDGSTKIVNATTNYKMYPQTYNLSKGTHTAIISWDSSAYRMTVSTW